MIELKPADLARPPKNEAKPLRSIESVLASHPFLAGLTSEQLRALNENAMRMFFHAGELIFQEGDPANRFYLIESGLVSIESHYRGESAVRIETVGSGDVLGWSWLFPPYYWHFDARALEPTTTIFFYGTRLREHCEQDRDLGYELMKRMAGIVIQRLQATRKQWLLNRG